MNINYTDFLRTEEISMATMWELYKQFPVNRDIPQAELEIREKIFYSGFCTALSLLSNLTRALPPPDAQRVAERLYREIRSVAPTPRGAI